MHLYGRQTRGEANEKKKGAKNRNAVIPLMCWISFSRSVWYSRSRNNEPMSVVVVVVVHRYLVQPLVTFDLWQRTSSSLLSTISDSYFFSSRFCNAATKNRITKFVALLPRVCVYTRCSSTTWLTLFYVKWKSCFFSSISNWSRCRHRFTSLSQDIFNKSLKWSIGKACAPISIRRCYFSIAHARAKKFI